MKLGHLELEFSAYGSCGDDEESSRKASKFSEAQIAFVLKQAADGTPVGEVCRKAGISDAALPLFGWRELAQALCVALAGRLLHLSKLRRRGRTLRL